MAKKTKFKPSGGGGKRDFEKKKGKAHNPFEIHINRVKHDVVGRKSKQDYGLPGVARAKAVRKRERTLLQEYKMRNKSNVFVDRRIGENNSKMDPEKKMTLRLAAVKRKEFSKKSLFNLNEDEELTHGGIPLGDGNFNDPMAISDDDEDAFLDAEFVKEKHFGGGDFLTKKEVPDEDGKDGHKFKNRKDWIDEIIAESKKKKAEFKKEKEEQHEAVSKLNAGLQSFMKIMSRNILTDDDKDKARKNCEFRDYDILVKELGFDRSGKAKGSTKLKTPEAIVKAEKEKLLALEADRVRRMKGEVDTLPSRSADDLDDGFALTSDDRFVVSYKHGKLLEEENEEAEKEGNSDDDDDKEEDIENEEEEEAEDGKDEESEDDEKDEEEEEEEEDDDESDKYSDILEESGSEAEEEVEDKKETLPTANTKVKVKTKEEIKEIKEAAKKEIPYTFEVPQEYDAFWELLENRSPQEVSIILDRMIACNHPSLGSQNKEICDTLYAYLLQTLNVVTEADGESPIEDAPPMMYVDVVIQYLYSLTQISTQNCAKSLLKVLEEKYEDCRRKDFKKYPMADTFVFLKLAGVLFPSSDYIHCIMTPVMVFLLHILNQARVTTQREVLAAFFTAHLLYEYLSVSRRFAPELTNLLNGLIFISIPGSNKSKLPFNPPFKPVGAASCLLVLHEEVTEYVPSKLTLAGLNNKEEEVTDLFKVNILCKTCLLLQQVCKTWTKHPAIRAIMAPTLKLIDALPVKNYPQSVTEAVAELKKTINSLPAQGPPLVKDEGKPQAIRMYEPAIEKIIEGVKKRHGTKDYLEKQKLEHKLKREQKGARREIQRDTAFLARQKLTDMLQRDQERKRKVGLIMGGLQTQEGEYKKMKKKK